MAKPVMFPPGRARLVTYPLPTGSLSCAITMGIVTAASLAARVSGGPAVTIMSTLRRTSSATERGEAIKFSLCVSILDDNVFPLYVPELAQSCRNALDARRLAVTSVGQPVIDNQSSGSSLLAAHRQKSKALRAWRKE